MLQKEQHTYTQPGFGSFGFGEFEFVSCFGFGISNLIVPVLFLKLRNLLTPLISVIFIVCGTGAFAGNHAGAIGV
jgi:hypothetical protein